MSARVKPDCQLKPNCQNCQLPIELSNWDVNDEVTRLSIETKLSKLPIETRWSKETKLSIVCQRFELPPRTFCERVFQFYINIIVFYPVVSLRVIQGGKKLCIERKKLCMGRKKVMREKK